MKDARIGFGAGAQTTVRDNELFRHVSTRDFIEYGFEPEFIGRLPVRVVCEELAEDDLFEIMKRSEGSIIRQYERDFRAYGIEISFVDESLRLIAKSASSEKTGARGLLTVCEKILRNFKYDLPGMGVTQFAVDRDLIEKPDARLRLLIEAGRAQRGREQAAAAHGFAGRFTSNFGVRMTFSDGAIARLIERAEREKISTANLCGQLFKDYEFGLKLIHKGAATEEFVIPAEVIDDPDKFLSDWLVKTYHGS